MLLGATIGSVFALAMTLQQPAQWRLVEEWRVGGEVNGPLSFGDVRGMGVLPGGGIVVLDHRDQQLHFFDPRGRPIHTTGRKGAGPGEFQRANGLAVSPRGEVVVNDPGNNRVTVLSSSGELIKTHPIPNPWGFGYLWDAFFSLEGRLNEFVLIRRGQTNETVATRRIWSADFTRLDTLPRPECPSLPEPNPEDAVFSFRNEGGGTTMGIPHLTPRISSVLDRDGTRWEGRRPGFETILRLPAAGCQPTATIRLSGSRVRIPEPVRDSALDRVRATAARYGARVPDLDKIPREYVAFDAMFLDPAGNLWVERRVDAKARKFEVYSAEGARLGEVALPVVFQGYRPLIVTGDRVIGFVPDEDELLYLASFRIVRGGGR